MNRTKPATNLELMRVLGMDGLHNVTAATITMRPNRPPEVVVSFLPPSGDPEDVVQQRFDLVARTEPAPPIAHHSTSEQPQ